MRLRENYGGIKMKNVLSLTVWFIVLVAGVGFGYGQTQAAPGPATYYVSVNDPRAGDDSSHGSLEQPWRSLEYAVQQLKPGDTLLLRAGTYTNNKISLSAQQSGQAETPITVAAYPNEKVIIDNGNTIAFGGTAWWTLQGLIFQNFAVARTISLGNDQGPAKHITIRNCTFRDSKARPIYVNSAEDIFLENNQFIRINTLVAGQGANAIELFRYAKRITIRNNTFIDNATDGIHMGATTAPVIEDVLVEGNKFWMTTDEFEWGENGIDIKTVQGPVIIRGNYFQGYRPTYRDGIGHAGGSNGSGMVVHNGAQNIQIEQNIFDDNTVHLTIADQQVDGFPPTQNISVINNIFRKARYYRGNDYRPSGLGLAIGVNRAAQNIKILHNTFVDNNYFLSSNGMQAEFRNNVINGGQARISSDSTWLASNNAWANIIGGLPAALVGTDDLTLTDLELDDQLRPLPTSPLINYGPDLGVNIDFAGNPRQDGHPDLGAFEGGSSWPDGTFLSVAPIQPAVYPGDLVTVQLQINAASELYGLQVACDFDPAHLVIQEALFSDFFTTPLVGARTIDAEAGTWVGAISQKNPAPALSGNGTFATLYFEAAQPGQTAVACQPVASDRNGFTLAMTAVNDTITVLAEAPQLLGKIAGQATYQGRTSHQGISLTAIGLLNRLAQTDDQGQFELDRLEANDYVIEVDAERYLPSCMTTTVADGETVTLTEVILRGGDTDDDDAIKINDATLIGSNFGLSASSSPALNPKADINLDGQVNIQDFAILGGNFGQQGCQEWSAKLDATPPAGQPTSSG
jgi:hypothetical protein